MGLVLNTAKYQTVMDIHLLNFQDCVGKTGIA
jgi:hypothetical protein